MCSVDGVNHIQQRNYYRFAAPVAKLYADEKTIFFTFKYLWEDLQYGL